MNISLVILAAGIGSRFGGLKQITPVTKTGESIIDFSTYDAIRSGFSKLIIVIRKDILDDFHQFFGKRIEKQIEIQYAFQKTNTREIPGRKKPPGTAHAVLAAKDLIDGPFSVINADDFYGYDAFQKAATYLNTVHLSEPEHAVIGYPLQNTLSDHGTVSRAECRIDENNYLTSIHELHKVFRKEGSIYYRDQTNDHKIPSDTRVSMNFWCYRQEILAYFETGWQKFIKELGANPEAEYLIPTVVNSMIEKNGALFRVIPTDSQWFGITYKEDFEKVSSGISGLIRNGVYPSPLWN